MRDERNERGNDCSCLVFYITCGGVSVLRYERSEHDHNRRKELGKKTERSNAKTMLKKILKFDQKAVIYKKTQRATEFCSLSFFVDFFCVRISKFYFFCLSGLVRWKPGVCVCVCKRKQG